MQPFSTSDFLVRVEIVIRCISSYRKLQEIWNAGLRAYAARLGEDNRNDRAGKLASAPLRTSAAKFRAANGADGPVAEGWCVMPLASRLQASRVRSGVLRELSPSTSTQLSGARPRIGHVRSDCRLEAASRHLQGWVHKEERGATPLPPPRLPERGESAALGSQPRHEGGLTRVSARVLSRLPHLTIDPLTHRRTSPCSPTAPRAACGTWPSFLRRR